MPEPGLLSEIGIKTQDIVAGLGGGIVNAIAFKRSDPLAVVSSMVVGAITANYLGEYGAKYTGTSEGTAAFIVGLCGMILGPAIVAAAAKWTPAFMKASTDAKP